MKLLLQEFRVSQAKMLKVKALVGIGGGLKTVLRWASTFKTTSAVVTVEMAGLGGNGNAVLV